MSRKPPRYWQIRENRIRAVRDLVTKLALSNKKVTYEDFNRFGLHTILKYYNHSPFLVLKDAGYNIDEREMVQVPNKYWNEKENRIKATRNLVKKLNKPFTKITQKDFTNDGLRGLLKSHYNGSPFLALKEAGYNIQEWERKPVPRHYWEMEENRIKAIRGLVNKLNKPISNITNEDFENSGLRGIMKYYNGSAFQALKAAGYDIEEWERKQTSKGYWDVKEIRISAIKRMVKALNKPVNEITYYDFDDNGLHTVLRKFYNYSPFLALKDAGYPVFEEEMRHSMFETGRFRYKSSHGHKFRSMFERDVDNTFWELGIKNHRHNVNYPHSTRTCDFVIGNNKYWIEVAGLVGKDWYDKKMKEKKEIAEKENLNLIIITDKDFRNKKIFLKKIAPIIKEFSNSHKTLEMYDET